MQSQNIIPRRRIEVLQSESDHQEASKVNFGNQIGSSHLVRTPRSLSECGKISPKMWPNFHGKRVCKQAARHHNSEETLDAYRQIFVQK